MRAATKPLGKAAYAAPDPDRDWLQNVQRALYRRSNQLRPVIYGEPGAQRKVHAGFGEGRAETCRRKPVRRRAPTHHAP